MAKEESVTDDLLKEGIANTEREISESVFEPEPEGDRSPEEMGDDLEGRGNVEGDEEADEQGEEGEGDEGEANAGKKDADGEAKPGETKPKGEEEPEVRKRVPVGELISERKARQAAEAATKTAQDELKSFREQSRSEFQTLNARLDAILAAKPKTPGQQEDEATDDIFSDPEGTLARREAALVQQFNARLVNASLSDAAETHGKDFEAAYSAITALDKANPADRAIVQGIWNAPNPGRALMNWHKRNTTLNTVGSDPEKWLADKLEEKLGDPKFLATALERAKKFASGGEDGKRPNNVTRLPSLNGAPGSNSNREAGIGNDNSEKSVSDYAIGRG